MGTVFIDRMSSAEGKATLQAAARQAKEEGWSLFMFPEGTRSNCAKELLPFKKGAFHIAIDAQVPILPVVFSHYDFIDCKKREFKSSGHVNVRILDPISTEGMDKGDVDKLLETTRTQMSHVYNEISFEGKKEK